MFGLYSKSNSQSSALDPPDPLVCPLSWVWGRGSKVKEKPQAGNGHSAERLLVWAQKTAPGGWARPGPGTTPRWQQCEEELSTFLTSTVHSGPAHFVPSAPDGGSLKVGLSVVRSSQRPRFSQSPQWTLPALLTHWGSLPSHLEETPNVSPRMPDKVCALLATPHGLLYCPCLGQLSPTPLPAFVLLCPPSQTHRSHPLLPIKLISPHLLKEALPIHPICSRVASHLSSSRFHVFLHSTYNYLKFLHFS